MHACAGADAACLVQPQPPAWHACCLGAADPEAGAGADAAVAAAGLCPVAAGQLAAAALQASQSLAAAPLLTPAAGLLLLGETCGWCAQAGGWHGADERQQRAACAAAAEAVPAPVAGVHLPPQSPPLQLLRQLRQHLHMRRRLAQLLLWAALSLQRVGLLLLLWELLLLLLWELLSPR